MPSPMIYQDLTTAALLGHAAQYHSETEIVSVSTGGEQERSSWGEVASRAQRLASALASVLVSCISSQRSLPSRVRSPTPANTE